MVLFTGKVLVSNVLYLSSSLKAKRVVVTNGGWFNTVASFMAKTSVHRSA